MTATPQAREELRFVCIVLVAGGIVLAGLAGGMEWIGSSNDGFGWLQGGALGLGLALVVLGVALSRFAKVRRGVRRLWPFGLEGPESPLSVLSFALVVGVAAGLLEVGLRFLQYELDQRWFTPNLHSSWMTPLSYLLLMLGIGAAFAFFAHREWRFLGSPRLAVFTLVLVGAVFPLSVYETELGRASIALLSLGLAAQASRVIPGRTSGVRRFVRGPAAALAVALAIVVFAPFAWRIQSERSAIAAMPRPPEDAPNVLLIILDTVRAQNLSLYGYPRNTTPNLEQLAARATVYDRAMAPSSWTLPSHASFFTGRAPHEQSGNFRVPLDDEHPTIAEVMRDRGYYTLGVVANIPNAYPHTGLDRGFIHYDAHVASTEEWVLASAPGRFLVWVWKRFGTSSIEPTRKNATVINERFLRLMKRRGERPYFAFLNYFDAHHPYQRSSTRDRPRLSGDPSSSVRASPGLIRRIDRYDHEIAYMDDRVGLLLAALDERGTLDDTIVIVTSDHGEEFGEHGKMGHGWNLYGTTLHVPLLVFYPKRVPENARVRQAVSLQDLPATILELAGLPPAKQFGGRNLISLARTPEMPWIPSLSELSGNMGMSLDESPGWDHRSLVFDRYHYIRNPDGTEELYEDQEDPWETRNLIDSLEGSSAVSSFRTLLSSLTCANCE